MAELKPCPFCGSKDIRRVLTLKHSEIYCASCQAFVSRGLMLGKCDSLDEAEECFGVDAIEAWNRRCTDAE